MVPGLRAGAFHIIFVSWRYKKLTPCALAGHPGVGHYTLQDTCFDEITAETAIDFGFGIAPFPNPCNAIKLSGGYLRVERWWH